MTQPTVPVNGIDDTLAYTQNLRRRIVTKLIGVNPEDCPEDPKVVAAINQTLDSMDRQALVLKRLNHEKQRGSDDRAAALMIAQINSKLGKGENLFRVGSASVTPATDPTVLTNVEPRKPEPGEDHIGVVDDSFDAFMVRLENDPNA